MGSGKGTTYRGIKITTRDFSPEIMEAKKNNIFKFLRGGENPANSRFHIWKTYSEVEIKIFLDKQKAYRICCLQTYITRNAKEYC